jgi:hypothetical protein
MVYTVDVVTAFDDELEDRLLVIWLLVVALVLQAVL